MRSHHGPILACCLGLIIGPAAAQTLLKDLPGYEQYRSMRDQIGSLVTGGEISRIQWSDDGATLRFERSGKHYECDLVKQELHEAPVVEEGGDTRGRDRARERRRPPRGAQRESEPSPDGKWIAKCIDWNVIIEPTDGGSAVAVTSAGTRKHRFGKASWVYGEELDQIDAMWWSPDSSHLAYYEFDESAVNDFHLVSGWTELHTQPMVEGYPKPGEPNPIARLHIFNMQTRESIAVDVGSETEQYVYNIRFSPDGAMLLFNRTNRKQNELDVLAADLETGVTRVIVTERQEFLQKNSPEMRFLADGRRFIWETEKTGWQHYELRDLDGRQICTLTEGDYPAANIVRVDEGESHGGGGVLFYTAYSGEHPLNSQLHRVNLDGSGGARLTPEPLNHSEVDISPDGKWFVARYEAVDTPPTTALYDTTGQRITTLAESDTSKFDSLELPMPELFTFKAADGETDLYGVLYKPSTFDASRSYPLIIDVYGGPLSQRVRNTFRAASASCELGFLIAVIDNRGTPNRGKAFEAATYLKLGTVDLADQVEGVRHLCKRRFVDAKRVGIHGFSYGGYMSALAILKYPDVFAAAVAGSAVTDWKNYDTIYTERYMWIPSENEQGYANGSCVEFADQLKGRLLIMHGMVDDNVHPNNAFQLMEALYAANRRFDQVFFPNAGHGVGRPASDMIWEFFHEHLVAPNVRAREAAPVPAGISYD
jgi:dipeptidyl-peptidase-4